MRFIPAALITLSLPALAWAGPGDFKTGPVIDGFGPHAAVPGAVAMAETAAFRIAFDAAKPSEGDALNRTFESAARFINMHAAAGVDPDRIDLAVIVHGGAAVDLLNAEAYAARKDGASNPNIELILALTDHGVRFILCGQTAAYRDIGKEDLLPGIELHLSAMTAHALLQQDGYTLNPF